MKLVDAAFLISCDKFENLKQKKTQKESHKNLYSYTKVPYSKIL